MISLERAMSASAGSGWRRMPALAERNMIATSHPLATQAGMKVFEAGGNAVDAALAAAAVMTVVEPSTNGLGGDMFAIVCADGELYGLNGSGRSPETIDGGGVDELGPRSVTVPGAVRAWSDLADRFGTRGLDGALRRAAELAEIGVLCTPRVDALWRRAERPPWPAPGAGAKYRFPDAARTLRQIADDGPDAFYRGPIAEEIAAACWLSVEDLAAHSSDWVTPLRASYRGVDVYELPPNTQGAAALIALRLLDGLEPTYHHQIEATKLALTDAYRYVSDASLPGFLLSDDYIDRRRASISSSEAQLPTPGDLPRGGTIYLCAVDEAGMAVSLIQSLYMNFGSGVVAGSTGVALQNRGACFSPEDGHPNQLGPGKRPFHTIIPAMLLRDGDLVGPLGVVGGPMQAQAHVQIVHRLVEGDDPQAALDAPRWRWEDGLRVEVEPGLAWLVPELTKLGHVAVVGENPIVFGAGQAIVRLPGGALVGGSDGRADGYAAGF